MDLKVLLLLTLISVITSGNSKEIKYADTWNGSFFSPNDQNTIEATEKDNEHKYTAMQVLLMRLQEVVEKRKLQQGSKFTPDNTSDLLAFLASSSIFTSSNSASTDNSASGGVSSGGSSAITLTGSSMNRTRRPQKYKKGENCKNKPKKHSDEIEEEDKKDKDMME